MKRKGAASTLRQLLCLQKIKFKEDMCFIEEGNKILVPTLKAFNRKLLILVLYNSYSSILYILFETYILNNNDY